ncbi:hypothetical protein [Staphylococcus arlettae]|uniref:hypothetical protein n=1 Tax=Staphylococcus arlettae TaxID=29378 RepID=UPI0010570CBF|nr:hypothetical protein [Staphylococcus arlettae]
MDRYEEERRRREDDRRAYEEEKRRQQYYDEEREREKQGFCCKVKIICTSIQNYKSQYCFNSKEFC